MQFTSQRLDKVYRAMQREEMDLLLITRAQDVQYLTGYQTPRAYLPSACLVSVGQTPKLIISELQKEFLGQDSVMSDIYPFAQEDFDFWYPSHSGSFWNHIIETIRSTGNGSGIIGLQQDWLSVRNFDCLKSALPSAGFRDFSSTLGKLRQVKDASEIDIITHAARIAEIGVRTALEIVSTEKSESDVSVEIESAMRTAGGHLKGIRAAVISGPLSRCPFAHPGPQRIRNDQPVVIDITVSHGGYFAEIARTIHLGRPSSTQRSLFENSLRIAESIESNMTPGLTIDELVKKVRISTKSAFSDGGIIFPLGSSIGLDLREPPHIVPENTVSLRSGMVFSIHPSCYNPKAGVSKVADVFYITDKGCESISTLARETM